MELYRFSPIKNHKELLEAIRHLHFACNKLCKASFGSYLPNSGNLGIFCHYDSEFELLTALREKLTKPSDDPKQKYYELRDAIVIQNNGEVPETIYTHLYIRKPDIYRSQVGDIDFFIDQTEYSSLKQSLSNGRTIFGARIFPRNDLDMIELFDPDIDALGYVSTNSMSEKVRVKLPDETKL